MQPREFGKTDVLESAAPAFHGYAPPRPSTPATFVPPLCVAISRETGSRGRTIAKRTAEVLGWHFVDQETLDYLANNPGFAAGVKLSLSPEAEAWVQQRLSAMADSLLVGKASDFVSMIRTILEMGAQGESIILGRGAGFVLPTGCRLNVRLVAPVAERVAFVAQVERLSLAEAEEFVRQRDRSRRRFILREFGVSPRQLMQFDLVLNTSELGVEGSAEVIAAAVREKEAFRRQRREI